MTMKNFLYTLIFSLINVFAYSQITPPGLGKTNSASWFAIGLKQKLNEKNTSVTYLGLGRVSGTDESEPINYPALFVADQEFSHKLNNHWKYNVALSYRRQHEYTNGFKEPAAYIKQEFRFYTRLKYALKFDKFKWAGTVRQEVRKFYNDDFSRLPNDFQLRTRLRSQLYYSLGSHSRHILSVSAEALFSIAHDADAGWDNFDYKESRFCLYYTFKPQNIPVVFDVGYMNDLIGYGGDVTDVNYLAFDIIVENPFSF